MRKNQKIIKSGFTLVELLIGVAISSIIALGVGMVYFAMNNSRNAQNSIGEIRFSAFNALDRIEYIIKHANFADFNESGNNPTLPIAPFIADNTKDASSNDANSDNGNDKFSIQLGTPQFGIVGPNTSEMVDCGGQAVKANSLLTQTFQVRNENLECIVNNDSPVIITNGIRNMQIFYATLVSGSNTCGESGSNNMWKTAAQVNSSNLWTKICAINISLLSVSQTKHTVNNKEMNSINSKEFILAPNTKSLKNDVYAKTTIKGTNNLIQNARIFNRVIHLRN